MHSAAQPTRMQFFLHVQVITNPLTKKIVSVNKDVIKQIAQGDSSLVENKRIVKVSIDEEVEILGPYLEAPPLAEVT